MIGSIAFFLQLEKGLMETQELHSELLSSLGEVRSSSTRNCIREESSTEDSEGVGIGSLGSSTKK
jgi:hypothetical protein